MSFQTELQLGSYIAITADLQLITSFVNTRCYEQVLQTRKCIMRLSTDDF